MAQTFSVTELSMYIRDLFTVDANLQDVWVTGEVSNFRRAASGHCYFTIKDGGAELKSVMWRSAAERQTTIPRDGDAVIAHGAVNVYIENGVYQLYVDRIRPQGVGDLYARFEQLKQQLQAEGLFDPERKRPLPAYPRKIGVVTSADAAAFQDVQNVLRRRYPLAEVILSPTLVQGTDAPPRIVRALERLNQRDDIDVILVCRGGGSIEDLWAFNDEAVARAIALSRVPVVSGVGHETDFTIADFAADLRAPTPSAAAELLTPDVDDLRVNIARAQIALTDAVRAIIDTRRRDLVAQNRALKSASPTLRISALRQRLDDWNTRLITAQRTRLTLQRERLNARAAALKSASPAAILERGYVLVRRGKTGERVASASVVSTGDSLVLQFHDGEQHVIAAADQTRKVLT